MVKRRAYRLETIERHMEESNGYCTHCQRFIEDGGVEPDARKYVCPDCGNRTVYGAEEAAMFAYFDVKGE